MAAPSHGKAPPNLAINSHDKERAGVGKFLVGSLRLANKKEKRGFLFLSFLAVRSRREEEWFFFCVKERHAESLGGPRKKRLRAAIRGHPRAYLVCLGVFFHMLHFF